MSTIDRIVNSAFILGGLILTDVSYIHRLAIDLMPFLTDTSFGRSENILLSFNLVILPFLTRFGPQTLTYLRFYIAASLWSRS